MTNSNGCWSSGKSVTTAPPYFQLWAKSDGGTGQVHPLIYHMIDVAEVLRALLGISLAPALLDDLARALGLSREEASRLLPLLGGLHDCGKASPQFQRKFAPAVPRLSALGLTFPPPQAQPAPHGAITAWFLEDWLQRRFGSSPRCAKQVARALGGHHGTWPTPRQMRVPALQSSDKGDGMWDSSREALAGALLGLYDPPPAFTLPQDTTQANVALTLFSGLVSVADWIGSDEAFFPYAPEALPLKTYSEQSSRRAAQALKQLGWVGWRPDGSKPGFTEMFGFAPRQAQDLAIRTGEGVPQPALFIVEAPTGSGKTETAFYLADRWIQGANGQGIYVAMPTQATSNQMFGRVARFLSRRYADQPVNLQLVHGGALLMDPDRELERVRLFGEDSDARTAGVRAEAWFLPRKRSLLAPFGVGTVDQALMSVLQTRHFFVRLFGLSGKVVIFDEVHAYDTYMSVLLKHLLRWLHAMGTSVILLSATLPEVSRRELANAWAGEGDVSVPSGLYPRVTLVAGGAATTVALPSPRPRSIRLAWIDSDPQAVVSDLREKLAEGGCAAVICNRVDRAQEIYKALRAAEIVPREDLVLFHARFPFSRREKIEKHVLDSFGKDGSRPQKAIVVSTQVLEQSLDLDFDYMVSDLAPVDLVLQRAGRLHRHEENFHGRRPEPVSSPALSLTLPAISGGLPDFGRDRYVYEPTVLLKSFVSLRRRDELTLPDETTALIESVYGEEPLSMDARMAKAIQSTELKAEQERRKALQEAAKRLVAGPEDEELLFSRNENLEEEDEGVHEALRALTRLAEPGISLVCLFRTEKGLALDRDGRGTPLDLGREPELEEVRGLLGASVAVQNGQVVHYFLGSGAEMVPSTWQRSAPLRNHYPVIFDAEGNYALAGTALVLHLDDETGLEIRRM